MRSRLSLIILFFINFCLFLLDRLSKLIVIQKLPSEGVFLFNHFGLSLEKNRGLAFGLPFSQYFILTSTIIILLLLFYFWLKTFQQKNLLSLWGLTLIIIGAFSNFFDRLTLGYIIDFIQLPYWSVFNLSDSYIVIGLLLIITNFYRQNKPK